MTVPGWGLAFGVALAVGFSSKPTFAADLGAAGELFGTATDLMWRTRDSTSHIINSGISRLRLELDGGRSLGDADISWRIAYDNEIIWGGLVKRPAFGALKAAGEPTLFDGGLTLTGGGSYLWRHKIFRASVAWEPGDWRVIVGRQRVAWGSGRVWNPTDRFNPTSATALEGGQKTGSDAVSAERFVGPFGSLQMVFAPGVAKRSVSRKVALRWRDTIGETDYAIIAGGIENEKIIGLDLAGNLSWGGWHIETSAGWPKNSPRYGQVVIGVDAIFLPEYLDQSVAFSLEYFRNGAATGNAPIGLAPDRVNSRRRDLWAFTTGYDLNFIWRAGLTALFDTQSGSRVTIPSLSWSASQDVDVTFSAQFFQGDATSEYGAGQDSFVALVAYYF